MMNYIYIAVTAVILCVFGYTYKLYKDNEVLENNQITLQKAIDEQYQVILKNKKDFEEIQSINEGYKTLNDSTNKRVSELTDVFTKDKLSTVIIDNKEYKIQKQRDIGKLAISKPKMIEDIVNIGTINTFSCFEKITSKEYKGVEIENVCK